MESAPRTSIVDLQKLAESYRATLTYVVVDDFESLGDLLERAPKPILLSSWKKETLDRFKTANHGADVHVLTHEIHSGINALGQLREALFAAYIEGFFGSNDRVLAVCRIRTGFELILFFDMGEDESVVRLKKELEYRADVKVVETVLQIASELAREGRERGHVGALFVIGDTERVMGLSKQIVINPFQGHPEEARNILREETWETAKEFSQIDGAFIVREDGVIEASGRYIEVKNPVSLPSGFGGRHLAAAHITKVTKAIAVTVSETGVIRVFKDGEILLRIGTN